MTAELRDIKDTSPNQNTIDYLETALAEAKAGRLRSIFVVCGWDNDAVTHGWSQDERNGRRRFLGALELAKFDFMTDTAATESDMRLSQMFNGLG